jgi:hypothetical protein
MFCGSGVSREGGAQHPHFPHHPEQWRGGGNYQADPAVEEHFGLPPWQYNRQTLA